jgi:hypothetical protein
MRFRVGILDISAAIIVLLAIVMPSRQMMVDSAYGAVEPDYLRDLDLYQARLAADPADGEAANRLVRLLIDGRQTDWALRVAGDAVARGDANEAWRALLAISTAHAARLEIRAAYQFATQALEACHRAGAGACPAHEEVRVSLYERQLEAGFRSGIDPRLDPRGFRRAVDTALRTVRLKTSPTVDE